MVYDEVDGYLIRKPEDTLAELTPDEAAAALRRLPIVGAVGIAQQLSQRAGKQPHNRYVGAQKVEARVQDEGLAHDLMDMVARHPGDTSKNKERVVLAARLRQRQR